MLDGKPFPLENGRKPPEWKEGYIYHLLSVRTFPHFFRGNGFPSAPVYLSELGPNGKFLSARADRIPQGQSARNPYPGTITQPLQGCHSRAPFTQGSAWRRNPGLCHTAPLGQNGTHESLATNRRPNQRRDRRGRLPHRGYVTKPRVAATRLPWVTAASRHNPEGVV